MFVLGKPNLSIDDDDADEDDNVQVKLVTETDTRIGYTIFSIVASKALSTSA